MLLVIPAAAVGQTCSASQPGTFNLRTNQPVIAFNQPGVNDFEAGWIEFSQNVQVRVRPNFGGNNQWALCLRSEDPDLGGYGKAVSDVEFRLTGDANWRPLDTVDQLAATGQGNQNVRLRFRVSLSYLLDEPGSYGALLAFTAYQQ
jgi:hypothetical protein